MATLGAFRDNSRLVGFQSQRETKDRVSVTFSAPTTRKTLDDTQALKERIHKKLVEKLDLAKLNALPVDKVRREVRPLVEALYREEQPLLNRLEQERVIEDILHDTFGYGPLEPLLADSSVSDILVNGPHKIYVERGGKLEKCAAQFRDDEHLLRVIDRIVSQVGRQINESSPMVEPAFPTVRASTPSFRRWRYAARWSVSAVSAIGW